MPKHKSGKHVRRPQVEEVFDLLERGKKVFTIVQETGIGRSKVYELWKEKRAKDTKQAQRQPANPFQEGVFLHCQSGDHGWMNDDRYEGAAFSKAACRETISAPEGPGWTFTWEERVCWFCGDKQRTERKIPTVVAGVFPFPR